VGKSHTAVKWVFKGDARPAAKAATERPAKALSKLDKAPGARTDREPLSSMHRGLTKREAGGDRKDPGKTSKSFGGFSVVLDQTVLQAAAMAFAAGEIGKAELMRRISR
jgi:hypothetical protein